MLSQSERQDIVEAAVMAIVTQGGPSVSVAVRGGAYRGDGGCKCVIGHFIDDAFYDPAFENVRVKELSVRTALEKSLGIHLWDEDVSFFQRLQCAHDLPLIAPNLHYKTAYFDRFSNRIKNLCAHFGLRFPEELL